MWAFLGHSVFVAKSATSKMFPTAKNQNNGLSKNISVSSFSDFSATWTLTIKDCKNRVQQYWRLLFRIKRSHAKNTQEMLPADRAFVSILSKCHWPCNDAWVAKHVSIVAKSAIIGYKKTASNSTANSFWNNLQQVWKNFQIKTSLNGYN